MSNITRKKLEKNKFVEEQDFLKEHLSSMNGRPSDLINYAQAYACNRMIEDFTNIDSKETAGNILFDKSFEAVAKKQNKKENDMYDKIANKEKRARMIERAKELGKNVNTVELSSDNTDQSTANEQSLDKTNQSLGNNETLILKNKYFLGDYNETKKYANIVAEFSANIDSIAYIIKHNESRDGNTQTDAGVILQKLDTLKKTVEDKFNNSGRNVFGKLDNPEARGKFLSSAKAQERDKQVEEKDKQAEEKDKQAEEKDKQAEEKDKNASNCKGLESQTFTKEAEALRTEAQGFRTEAEALRTEAQGLREDDDNLRNRALDLRKEAQGLRTKAQCLETEAQVLRNNANAHSEERPGFVNTKTENEKESPNSP